MTVRLALALSPLFALSFAACGGDEESDTDAVDTSDETDTNAGDPSKVRVSHGSPDAPAVDVWVKELGVAVFEDVAYGETTDFIDVPAGTYTIELRVAGADGSEPAAWSTELTVPEGETITALAAGLLGSTADAEEFRILPLVHGFDEAPANSAIVRIVHASATAPTVDIDVGNDGQAELSGVARWAESGAAGVPLPAGEALQVGIWAGGARVTAFTTPELPAGAEIFVIATGLLSERAADADGFSLLAVAPTGSVGFVKQNPVVFALHASPDAPAVDVAAGSTVLGRNLAFGQLSGVIQVPPGAYDLALHASPWNGTAAPAFAFKTPELVAGGRYLAVATGFLGSTADKDKFRVVPLVEDFDVADDKVGLRAMHASPDAPTVDIGTVASNTVTPLAPFTGVPFPVASGAEGVELAAGTYNLGVAVTTEKTPVFTFTGVPFAAGDRVIAVAAGSLGSRDAAKTFRLLAVDTASWPWAVATVLPDAR